MREENYGLFINILDTISGSKCEIIQSDLCKAEIIFLILKYITFVEFFPKKRPSLHLERFRNKFLTSLTYSNRILSLFLFSAEN